jgi:hypothetical protein
VVGSYFELQRIHPEQSPPTPSRAPSGDTDNAGWGCGSGIGILFLAWISLRLIAWFFGL